MIGVTDRLALPVHGADWTLPLYLMIGVTGRLALPVHGADWTLPLYLIRCYRSTGTSCG